MMMDLSAPLSPAPEFGTPPFAAGTVAKSESLALV